MDLENRQHPSTQRHPLIAYLARYWRSTLAVAIAAGAVAVPISVALYWLLGEATQTTLLTGARYTFGLWFSLAFVGWLVQALLRLRPRWQVTTASLAVAVLLLCVGLPVGTWYRYGVDHIPRGSEYASVAVHSFFLDSPLTGPWGSDAMLSRVMCRGAERDLRAHIDKLMATFKAAAGTDRTFNEVVLWPGATETPTEDGVIVEQPLGLEWGYTDSRGQQGTQSMSGGVWRFEVIEDDGRWQVCGLTSPQICWWQDGTECFLPAMTTNKRGSRWLP